MFNQLLLNKRILKKLKSGGRRNDLVIGTAIQLKQ